MKNLNLHIEWVVFLGGLILLAMMETPNSGHSLCLFEWAGFEFCLGDGLGHSIAYLAQGDIKSALDSNIMGPIAVFVLSFRILSIWKKLLSNYKDQKMGTNYV
jgi:hypothetical protein